MPKFRIYAIFEVEAANADEAGRLLGYSIDTSGDASYRHTERVVELDADGKEVRPVLHCGCQTATVR
jgi:hypothetical protein